MEKIKVYARTNETGTVTEFLNTVFDTDRITESDIFLCEGYGDEYAHPHLMYQLIDNNGLHLWKISDGIMTETTSDDRQSEADSRPKPPKTQLEQLQETVEMLILNALEG